MLTARKRFVGVRLSESEFEALERFASEIGETKSDIIRLFVQNIEKQYG